MKDTPASVEIVYRELLMRRSGEDRILMAGRMFDGARMLIRASLESQGVESRTAEARSALFLRLYGNDFDPETRERYAARLRHSATDSIR